MRDPAVQFANSDGEMEARSAYYWSNYSTIHDVVRLLPHLDLLYPAIDPSRRYWVFSKTLITQ